MTAPQTGIWISDPQVYRAKMFQFLGDRSPLEVLAQTPSTLDGMVRKYPAAMLHSRPFEGKWTPNEIIGHFVDSEWVYGFRLRLVFCEENASILGMNQDLWVMRQRHNEREPSELVEAFQSLRGFNLTLWKAATPADMNRTGNHNQRGPESLDVMLRMWAGHDLSHLDQLTHYIQAAERVA